MLKCSRRRIRNHPGEACIAAKYVKQFAGKKNPRKVKCGGIKVKPCGNPYEKIGFSAHLLVINNSITL